MGEKKKESGDTPMSFRPQPIEYDNGDDSLKCAFVLLAHNAKRRAQLLCGVSEP